MSREERIHKALTLTLSPQHLEIVNESYQHNVPENSETHFKVIIVSNNFAGLSLVTRHQQIYKLLQDEMQQGLHALSLHTYTPDEWTKTSAVAESPKCRGGEARENVNN